MTARPGVLVLDGDPPTAAELAAIPADAFVVAADGGANCLVAADRWPDVVVGDMESIHADVASALIARGVQMERHPEAKDDIDGILALERLLQAAPASVWVLGALGGRTAMALANLEVLRRCLQLRVPARITADGETLYLLRVGDRLEIPGAPGRVFNVVPDTEEATFSVSGSRFDVDEVTVPLGSSRGVSNAVAGSMAEVRAHRGRVLVVVEPDLA